MVRRALIAVVLGLALAPAAAQAATAAGGPRVLLFTKTTGFRHTSIVPAVAALTARFPGAVHSEDAAVFRPGRLRAFDVVVFLLTSGEVLDGAQRAALKRYVRAGGGWVG